jgi:WD40 repeat protein
MAKTRVQRREVLLRGIVALVLLSPSPLAAQAVATFTGHTDRVLSVAFKPDGKRLASASLDQTVKVWDAQTAQEILTLKGHTDYVQSVAFSPDGKRLASASADKTVKVWDAQTGQQALSLKGYTGFVSSVAFSPDGKRLASGGSGYDPKTRKSWGEVKVWNAQTGQLVLSLKGHIRPVLSVAFSPDGKRLASASSDKTVRVWDAETGQEVLTLQGHTSSVFSVAFSPDGKHLASASAGYDPKTRKSWGEAKVWSAQTGQLVLSLKGHTDPVLSVAFSPDGKRLASASGDILGRTPGEVKVWDAQTGQEVLTLQGHTSSVFSVAFSPDGKRLASASSDKTVKVWEAARPSAPKKP